MKEALLWEPGENGRVRCTLCPRLCNIPQGKPGFCFVRHNEGGRLYNVAYGRPTALHIDPIEKKPLFHFLPGTPILSLGTAGCNMGCRFCQNWDLSRARAMHESSVELPPPALVQLAIERRCPSIAFTYNEPNILAEYVVDTAPLAHERGVKIVMVTNGYIAREAVRVVYDGVDAANVDLKAFTDMFYRKQTYSRLKPVLEALVEMKKMGVHLEITTLLIPGLNTDENEIRDECRWVVQNLGRDIPLHFTAFHPDYRMRDRPGTAPSTLKRAREIGMAEGLRFVYEGNVLSDGTNTYCPSCGKCLVERSWHQVTSFNLGPDLKCSCGERVPFVL